MRSFWKLTLATLVTLVPVAPTWGDVLGEELIPRSGVEYAQSEEIEMKLFSDEALRESLDASLVPSEINDEPSPFQLVQREEPFAGTTPEEQVLRQRVRQAEQQQGSAYTPRAYSYNQPGYTGSNSLLPGYGGYSYGGFSTGYNSRKRLNVSVSQTADYVTNLSLPLALTPFNVPVRKNDAQFQSNVFAQYRVYSDDVQSITTGFNFYQSLHSSVEQLDLTAYTSLTQYTRKLTDRLTAYSYYNYTYYLLDHDKFLSANNYGGGFAFQKNRCVNWIFNMNLANNGYYIAPAQDSDTTVAQLQRYKYFGRDLTQYWFGGYAYGYNNAVYNGFSYSLHNFFLGAGKSFGCNLRNQALVYGSYGYYGFKGPDFQTGTIRQDSIYTLTTRLARNIGPHSTLFAQYTFFSSDSNVARQNFDSHLVSVGGLLYW
ncbi:MAG: hypothetical protein K8U03_09650 [Planctomycetia bacterium]|nr:hypothetical protein [Planctomycetia bacterium]